MGLELPINWDVMAGIREWIQDATQHPAIQYPDAACLSTLSPTGYPEGRWVLVRLVTPTGLVFFTNHRSHKAQSLQQHPKAGLTFYWEALGRQIRVTGDIEVATMAESDDYFASRPRISQLGAWASQQSQVLDHRETLMKAVDEWDQSFQGEVPRPPHWGGFRLVPIQVEFWQEGDYRLHDRFVYQQVNGKWHGDRRYP